MKINEKLFEEFSGKNIKIGVVDTGINSSILPDSINAFKINCADYEDYVGHGTKVAQIIDSLTDSAIFNVKIFDRSSNTTVSNVLEGIEYGIKENFDIINLSLGTKDFSRYKDFYSLCEEARKKNIFIVGAISNNCNPSLPAILSNVIGVDCANHNIEEKYGFYFLDNEFIQCVADGGRYGGLINQNALGIRQFTSLSAPIISSIIAILLEFDRSINFEKMLSSLKYLSLPYSKKCSYFDVTSIPCDLIKKIKTGWLENKIYQSAKEILYFPVFEEYKYFTEYEDLLKAKISYKLNERGESNQNEENNFQIKLSSNPELSFSEADLLIISQNSIFLSDDKQLYLRQLCKYFMNEKKNILSYLSKNELERLIEDSQISNYEFIIYTNSSVELFSKNELYFQAQRNIPTICILNLSNSNHYYFKMQLQLRRCFLKKEIMLAQIGTKFFFELFGFNYTLNSKIYANGFPFSKVNSFVQYVHNEFVSDTNTDLMVYAFDNSIMSLGNKEDESATANSILFTTSCLNNIKPDSFILFCDRFTDKKYIEQNIEILNNLYNPDQIIVMFSLDYAHGSHVRIPINNKKERYTLDKTKRSNKENIYFINSSVTDWDDKICNLIIKFYSE